MLIIYLLLLALGIFVLIKAADYSIEIIKAAGLKLKIPTFILSSIFIAAATSFPELSVGIISAVNKEPSLSLGNVLGANMVNLTLVLGITTLISNGVKVREKMIFKDLFVTFLIAVLPFFLLFDGILSRQDGVVFILIYLFYQLFLVGNGKEGFLNHRYSKLKKIGSLGFQFVLVMILLAASAQLIVALSDKISEVVNLPLSIIGVFFLSLGTTIPEMVVQLKSAESKEDGIFFGNVLGSVVINSTLVIGITSLIYPIKIFYNWSFIVLGVFTFIVFALLPVFLRSKKKLERKEGAILLLIYLLFLLTGFLLR